MNGSDNVIRGRCYCGRIQFTVVPPTKMFSHCHCESCRRSHGAPFVSWTSVANDRFQVIAGNDLISSYESSPGVLWQFCKNCGSQLFQTTRQTSNTIYIAAASLTDPMDRPPEGHFSYEERVPWLDIGDNLPKFRAKTSDLIKEREGLTPGKK